MGSCAYLFVAVLNAPGLHGVYNYKQISPVPVWESYCSAKSAKQKAYKSESIFTIIVLLNSYENNCTSIGVNITPIPERRYE
jgi:hypothetical protein